MKIYRVLEILQMDRDVLMEVIVKLPVEATDFKKELLDEFNDVLRDHSEVIRIDISSLEHVSIRNGS
jgi:hypothetical protein